jgi:hypothetical protein
MKTEIYFITPSGEYEWAISLRPGILNPATQSNLYVLTEGDVDFLIERLTEEKQRVYHAKREDTEEGKQDQDNG